MKQNRNESGMRCPLSGFLLGFLPFVLLGTTAIISSCSDFGGDSVANVYAPADSAPASTPNVPESMKTGTVTGDVGLPPQGL